MIITFSKNPIKQVVGIIYWNRSVLFFFAFCAAMAYTLIIHFEMTYLVLPAIPVSILCGALAIFLGFRNSSAYDRWWEARKIWGAIVNNSRSFGMELISYGVAKNNDQEEMDEWIKKSVRRHIGWVYALRSSLRKEPFCKELKEWIPVEEQEKLMSASNIPTQLLVMQGREMSYAHEKGWIEEFRFNALIGTLKKLYDDQGKSERIKGTVFPFYYNYFTLFFLWLFTFCLPFALAGIMSNWILIPISIAISFAFAILNKSGVVTETPFEGRAADIPLSNICRTVEIDLLQMINEKDIPAPLDDEIGKFGVRYKS